jgi:Tetratricopeptide repeat
MRTDNPLVNFNRGTRYLESDKIEKALACFKAEAKVSEFKELWLNMGNCYRRLGRDSEAIAAYKRSCDSAVPFAHNVRTGPYDFALTNLGLMYYRQERDVEACELYYQALEANPNHYDAGWNLSAALLRRHFSGESGIDLVEAWNLYECRFYRSMAQSKIDSTKPRWDGISSGKSIVVLAEQGAGDRFQFGRFIHLLEELFETVWVQCAADMVGIFSRWKTCQLVAETDAEVCVPICSLERYFYNRKVRDDWLRDYVVPDIEIPLVAGKKNIGVCWAGSGTHANDRYRSCGPEWFLPLSKEYALWNMPPGCRPVRGITNVEPRSWEETIAWVRKLDLVVTVDTSLVHVCGSLGVPCIMMQPMRETDFRWGNSKTLVNPQYRSVLTIHNPNNWAVVFAEVKDLLRTIYAEND